MRFVLLFLASLAILLVGMEIVLRTWLVSPDFKRWDPELGKLNRAGARVVWSREGWGTREINSLGLLGPEPASDPVGTRVALFGNSFTEALNVSRADSFEGGIEARLTGVEVVNAAHSAWSMAHELVFMKRITPVLNPDIIVAQVSDVPLFDPTELHVRPADDGWEVVSAPTPAGARATIKAYTDPYASRSAVVTMLLEKLNTLRGSQVERLRAKFNPGADGALPLHESSSESRDVLEVERSATRWIIQQMQAQDRPLILLLIPSLRYEVGACAPDRPERRHMIHELAVELDVPLVDSTNDFCAHFLETSEPGHGFHNLVMGDGHLNAVGHRIIADDLSEAIGRIVR